MGMARKTIYRQVVLQWDHLEGLVTPPTIMCVNMRHSIDLDARRSGNSAMMRSYVQFTTLQKRRQVSAMALWSIEPLVLVACSFYELI